jgi:hypothetical protein
VTDTLTETTPAPATTAEWQPETVHLTCCQDEDRSQCGLTLQGEVNDEAPDCDKCVVCLDLEQSKTCPHFGRCPE